MPSKKKKASVKDKSAVSRALTAELKTLLQGKQNIEVIGHIDSAALCCGNGTVALVKFDMGDPAIGDPES